MNTRFNIDLLHPGWVTQTWQDWFVGVKGSRRLTVFGVCCLAVLLVVFVVLILPGYWQLNRDLGEVPKLRRDLDARQTDLQVLRTNLGTLTQEAKRQVRWAEVLNVLSQQTPPTIKLQLVDAPTVVPPGPAGQRAGGAGAKPESLLRIDALTPLQPGPQPLLDVAQFMAGLMRDPAVNKRFQLRSWEIKPAQAPSGSGAQLLQVSIVLAERAQ